MAELPPPPRLVHFTARYSRDRWIAVTLSACVVIGLAIGAVIQYSSYRSLLLTGKAAWTVVQSRTTYYSSKGGTTYYLNYQLPGGGYPIRTSVDSATYYAYPQGSYLTLTVDPTNPPHHVIGAATPDELSKIAQYWTLGILGVVVICAMIYLGIIVTGKSQFTALAAWDFAHSPVLHSRVYSGKSTSTSITVEVPSTLRQIRTFTLPYAFQVLDGQPLDVLYDAGSGGVRLLSALTYVELGPMIISS